MLACTETPMVRGRFHDRHGPYMIELLTLLIFIAGAWFWTDGMRAREAALDAGRRACTAEGVQLLDWTVMLKRPGSAVTTRVACA